MAIAFIAIGSNLGDKKKFLDESINLLKYNQSIQFLKISKYFRTDATDFREQPEFLNAIIKIDTSITPIKLLDLLQSIELQIGRVRRFNKGPREIDLDILCYSNLTLNTERLTLPHPALFDRPFIRDILLSIQEEEIINLFPREDKICQQ